MSRQVYYSIWRQSEINYIRSDLLRQVPVDIVGFNTWANIYDFYVRESLVFIKLLIVQLISSYSGLKIFLCLLASHVRIIEPMHFDFFNIIRNNVSVITNRLNPY